MTPEQERAVRRGLDMLRGARRQLVVDWAREALMLGAYLRHLQHNGTGTTFDPLGELTARERALWEELRR